MWFIEYFVLGVLVMSLMGIATKVVFRDEFGNKVIVNKYVNAIIIVMFWPIAFAMRLTKIHVMTIEKILEE